MSPLASTLLLTLTSYTMAWGGGLVDDPIVRVVLRPYWHVFMCCVVCICSVIIIFVGMLTLSLDFLHKQTKRYESHRTKCSLTRGQMNIDWHKIIAVMTEWIYIIAGLGGQSKRITRAHRSFPNRLYWKSISIPLLVTTTTRMHSIKTNNSNACIPFKYITQMYAFHSNNQFKYIQFMWDTRRSCSFFALFVSISQTQVGDKLVDLGGSDWSASATQSVTSSCSFTQVRTNIVMFMSVFHNIQKYTASLNTFGLKYMPLVQVGLRALLLLMLLLFVLGFPALIRVPIAQLLWVDVDCSVGSALHWCCYRSI